MEFFLSAEAQAGAAGILSQLNRLATQQLRPLMHKEYGSELKNISIISILVRPELFRDGGYPERILFQRRQCSADVRLRLDYYEFICATPDERSDIYCKHLLKSLNALRRKVSCHYNFDELVRDVSILLEESRFRESIKNIKRFP